MTQAEWVRAFAALHMRSRLARLATLLVAYHIELL